jgi:uncharacterized repeat protein (TIGR01451 family)
MGARRDDERRTAGTARARAQIAVVLAMLFLATTSAVAAAHAGVLPRGLGWSGAATAPTDNNALALDIANAIARDPAQVTGASWANIPAGGTPDAVSTTVAGSFPVHGGAYGLLTSGNAALAFGTQAFEASVIDDALAARGPWGFDVSVLKIDVNVPETANCLWVRFAYDSEEFPEYVPTGTYNDGFVAELDGSTWTTSGTHDQPVISAPDNFAFDPLGNVVSVKSTGATSMSAASAVGTVYDGGTALLAAATPITAGAHSVYFSIFDMRDRLLDSAVFLDDLVLETVAPGACSTGARKAPPSTLTATKTADAPSVAPSAKNGYTITISNPSADSASVKSISDDLPAGFSYSVDTTTGVTQLDPAVSGQKLTWTGPFTVPAHGAISTHFEVRVSTTPGTYLNTAGAEDTEGATLVSTGPTAEVVVTAPPQETLTVEKAGTGQGRVTSGAPGIDCGGDCSESYDHDSLVTLTASAEAGSQFAGWSGACTNVTGDCVVTMDAARAVTARFTLSSTGDTTTLLPYGA